MLHMRWDIRFPDTELSELIRSVEELAADQGLSCLRSTHKTKPGSVHWHFKRKGEKGTLELTLWPHARVFWLEVRKGRESGETDWASGVAELYVSVFSGEASAEGLPDVTPAPGS